MFKVGDKVRVKAGVVGPRHGWGDAKRYQIGLVVRLVNFELMKVDFPNHRGWSAFPPEMELIKDKPKAKKPKPKVEVNNPPKKPFTAKDIHNRPVYAQLKASAVDARTLTKLVKAYLVNLNARPDAEEKFVRTTTAVVSSFDWGNSVEGANVWRAVQAGRQLKFEDIKPKVVKKVVVPKALQEAPIIEPAAPVAQPQIGGGERPEGATHWSGFNGKWLKVDINGVVSYWSKEKEWCEYFDQAIAEERVRNAIDLEPVAEMVVVKGRRGQPKPVVEQPAQEVKEPAPRIGWW